MSSGRPLLEDRHLALVQAGDALLVDVGADDVVTEMREARGGGESDVPRADDCDVHGRNVRWLLLSSPRPAASGRRRGSRRVRRRGRGRRGVRVRNRRGRCLHLVEVPAEHDHDVRARGDGVDLDELARAAEVRERVLRLVLGPLRVADLGDRVVAAVGVAGRVHHREARALQRVEHHAGLAALARAVQHLRVDVGGHDALRQRVGGACFPNTRRLAKIGAAWSSTSTCESWPLMNFRFGGHGDHLHDAGVDLFEGLRQREDVGESEVRVAGDVRHRLVDDAVDLREVPEPGLHGLVRERADEVLLTPDAAEVGGAVLRPLPVGSDVLVFARPRVRQRLLAVEAMAAGGVDLQPGFLVLGRRREVDGHRADRVDDLLESGEVDLQVVVDRDVEVLLDRLDDALRTAVERGVELRAAQAGDLHPQVTRERHEQPGVGVRVDVGDHDRVRALARLLGRVPEVRLVGRVLDERARVRADDEEVRGLAPLRLRERARVEAGGLRGVDLVGRDPVRHADPARGEDRHEQQREHEALEEGAHLRGRAHERLPRYRGCTPRTCMEGAPIR